MLLDLQTNECGKAIPKLVVIRQGRSYGSIQNHDSMICEGTINTS